uniref:DUF6988 family protein n=1 Tax=Pseudomonas sp. G.S.17 TaxID=3137451 RepID=UPI004054668E
MIDGLLDGSDKLHLEILSLLEGTPSFPGIRFEVAYVACAVALEHALSLILLVRTQCFTSAVALTRLQFEALTRGMWLLYAASLGLRDRKPSRGGYRATRREKPY